MHFTIVGLICWLVLAVGPAAASNNNCDFVKGNHGSGSFEPINGCPCLDFSFRSQNTRTMPYNIELENVKWVESNIYTVTLHVTGQKQIPLKSLWSLKIIGVNSPDGSTFQLFGYNEKTYLIDNPTDWTATFRVYGQADSNDPSIVWMPTFQIQYEYCQGSADCSDWSYGTTTFDLITGCNNYDNYKRSQTDAGSYFWPAQLSGETKYPQSYPCEKPTSTLASSSSTSTSSTSSSASSTSTISVSSTRTNFNRVFYRSHYFF